jgi:DNA primase
MSDFEAVKQRADIVDVITPYASLQRAGRYFKACCPFHNEKTPSFYVYPERQSWHCYGACSTGGDVFTFIEKKENLTPVEAMRLLAERYGVQLQSRGRIADAPAGNRLIEANEAAAQFFHNLLLNAAAGGTARDYLARRGLDDATVRDLQLGAAAEGWESLKQHLAQRGFTEEEVLAAGLLVETEREGKRRTHDRFRGRVMFPIRDERGRVIGFGGRVLTNEPPKYLNTAQTALFDKSSTLYALDRAKDAIRTTGMAVVVEGYMDAIAAHQHGIANVVATLGTAITERHVALLRRYARQVVLAMDADAAGIEAALRGEELVRRAAPADGDSPAQVVVDWRSLVRVQAAAPLEVRVFTVPQGKDPDEAIRADPDAFRELAQHAVPPFEFRLRHELARIDRDSPRERLALADKLLPLVAGIADRVVQTQYLGQLAQATAIAEEVLKGRLQALAGTKPEPLRLREPVPRAGPSTRHEAPAEGPDPDEEPSLAIPPAAGSRSESLCLRLLLTYDELRERGLALADDVFIDPTHRALFQLWRSVPAGTLSDAADDGSQETLSRVLTERLPPYDSAAATRAFDDVVKRMQLRRLEDRSRLLAASVREAQKSADGAQAAAAAVAIFAGEAAFAAGGAGELELEVAERLVQGMELARNRHTLETGLRGGAKRPSE